MRLGRGRKEAKMTRGWAISRYSGDEKHSREGGGRPKCWPGRELRAGVSQLHDNKPTPNRPQIDPKTTPKRPPNDPETTPKGPRFDPEMTIGDWRMNDAGRSLGDAGEERLFNCQRTTWLAPRRDKHGRASFDGSTGGLYHRFGQVQAKSEGIWGRDGGAGRARGWGHTIFCGVVG